jgi:FAD:protein FMN transferase
VTRALTPTVATERTRTVHHRENVMGTVVTFELFVDEVDAGSDIYVRLAKARAVLHRADAVFSTWRDQSPINRLRRGEISIEQCPSELAEVLDDCMAIKSISSGWFDPWAMPGGVDPTGYVKGWAAQSALACLDSARLVGAIVNAAGDIASFGTRTSGEPFRIGIVDPCVTNRLACVAEPIGAIAMSGTYERGAHLVDPYSRRPTSRVASASVTGPDLGTADALATALAVAGAGALTLIEELEGYEGLTIGFDGARRWTTHFPFGAAAGTALRPRK